MLTRDKNTVKNFQDTNEVGLKPIIKLGWITKIYIRPPSLIVFSPSSMLQLGRSPVFVARLVPRTLLPVSTGYAHPSEFSSSWRSLFAELFTALLLHICPTYCVALLTYRQDVVFDHRSLIVLTSVRPASSLSATVHFLLPAPRCGKVCQTTSHLPRRCQCFVVN